MCWSNSPRSLLATCLLLLQLLLQGSFLQEEVKQPLCRNAQKPNIMSYQGPPEAPVHLPLATLPCLPEQCNHCGKNLYKNSLSKHMLIVHGASRFKKYCKTDISLSCWHTEGSSATSASRRGSALRSTLRGVLICWHLDLQVSRAGL